MYEMPDIKPIVESKLRHPELGVTMRFKFVWNDESRFWQGFLNGQSIGRGPNFEHLREHAFRRADERIEAAKTDSARAAATQDDSA